MKIISSKTQITYNIDPQKNGENYMQCPECSTHRKKKHQKCFSWNDNIQKGYCNHCNTAFFPHKELKIREKIYIKPIPKQNTKLTDKALNYLLNRGITIDAINYMKLYSDNEYIAELNKNVEVICFPYYRNNELINIKCRGANKTFKLHKDSELIWYNFDALQNNKTIIIVEGEIDLLTLISIGYYNVISVPNGANARKMEYLDASIDFFEEIEKIIIAVDNDQAGLLLRNELLIRLGQEKCYITDFKECKDSNEFVFKYSKNELIEQIENSYQINIEGIVYLDREYDNIYNLFINGLQRAKIIDMPEFDNQISWETSRLAVITGIPSHGKSEVLDFILVKLNLLYNWKVAFYSPENYPIQYHYAKIASKLSGQKFQKSDYFNDNQFDTYFDYIIDNYFFIYPENDCTIDSILLKAKYLIKKYGVKCIVIDPYNKLEHQRTNNQTETEYISKLLDKCSLFAKQFDILMFIVAHPTKMKRNNATLYDKPSLYDISGSANWYNKVDYGLIIFRNFTENYTEIITEKVKFKHLGQGGTTKWNYNVINGRFQELENQSYDFESWLPNNNEIIENKLIINELDF